MVGKGQTKRRDSEPVQQTAERDMTFGVGVPLRQHQHGATAPAR